MIHIIYKRRLLRPRQLRSIRPLSLETPPMIVPLSFEGVEPDVDGIIAEKELIMLFPEKNAGGNRRSIHGG